MRGGLLHRVSYEPYDKLLDAMIRRHGNRLR